MNKIVAILMLSMFTCQPSSMDTSMPMICTTSKGRVSYVLEDQTVCPTTKGLHTDSKWSSYELFLWKKNVAQHEGEAYHCKRTRTVLKTYINFLKVHWEADYSEQKPVTEQECWTWVEKKSAADGLMQWRNTFWSTSNNPPERDTRGGVFCCSWKEVEATNSFVLPGKIFYTFGKSLESNLADVSSCKGYSTGHCTLWDGSVIVWRPEKEAQEELTKWKEVFARSFDLYIMTNDNELAFTPKEDPWEAGLHRPIETDQGITFSVSARGQVLRNGTWVNVYPRDAKLPVPFEYWELTYETASIPFSTPENRETLRSGKRFERTKRGTYETNKRNVSLVSSSQLAAQLQALETRLQYKFVHDFQLLSKQVCDNYKRLLEATMSLAYSAPTIMARKLLGTQMVMGKTSGRLLHVWPCQKVKEFSWKAMGNNCTNDIPITYQLHGHKKLDGYIDPSSHIIYSSSQPTDCNLVREIPIQIAKRECIYHSMTGRCEDAPNSTRNIFLAKFSSKVDLAILTHSPVDEYTLGELVPRNPIGDMMKTLEQHEQVSSYVQSLGGVGKSDQSETFVNAMQKLSLYGFLFGNFNFYQIWVFLCCLFVTMAMTKLVVILLFKYYFSSLFEKIGILKKNVRKEESEERNKLANVIAEKKVEYLSLEPTAPNNFDKYS